MSASPLRFGLAVVSGLLLAVGGSPANIWPATIIGFTALSWVLVDRKPIQRWALGFVAGATLFLISIGWTQQFNVVGYIILALFQAAFFGVASMLVKVVDWRRLIAFPAAFTLVELTRWHFPFGGFPMGGVTTGQASGPLLPTVALFGELGLVFLTALAGVAIHHLVAPPHSRRSPVVALSAVLLVALIGWAIPTNLGSEVKVALVQGGGPQALKRNQQDPTGVFHRHVDATVELIKGDFRPQVIVWPENVINLDEPIAGTSVDRIMSTLSEDSGATIVAGVVESEGKRFRNAVVTWNDGEITSRYEKVQRVPFGEYVPGRDWLSRMVDLSQVPNDAIVGEGPAVVSTQAGLAGVSISYEGLFSRRARAAIQAGGEILFIPTNAASYKSPNVAKAQVQAARLRAVETGRWVVQASPTGISAIVDPEGLVRARTAIGPMATLTDTARLSQTTTPYTWWGDWPVALGSLAALLTTQVGRPLRPSRAGSRSSS